MNGHDEDKPVVIEYTNGTKVTLPSLKEMMEDQNQKWAEEEADKLMQEWGLFTNLTGE